MNYKNIHSGEIISASDYQRLPESKKPHYTTSYDSPTHSVDDSGDFMLSAIIGAATGSGIIGGLIGGDMVGGILGDALFGDDNPIF